MADECTPATDTRCTTECLNGGTCVLTEISESLCDCAVGFTGSTCETKLPSCPVHYCHNGGICFLVHGQSVCLCRSQFTGSTCETVVCEAEADVPVYPGSSVTYSWSWTEGGRTQTRPCPDICRELIDYPSGAVVERLCHRDSGQWLDTDFTACGLTATALQLCEASQGKSGVELAATVVQVSSNASALESPTIAVISSIVDNLTESAIEDTQVREAFLSIVDNVLDASTSELLTSQTLANSSTIILQALESFLVCVPLDNDTGSVTFTRTNFGVVALSIGGLYHTESNTQLSFSADLGPVETAVYYDNSTISPEQLLVHSGDPPASTTGVISLQDLGTCPENRENERIVYSAFRTNALFLTPETACNQSAIGSIVLGVKKSGSKNCSSQSVIVDLQQLNKVCKMMHNTASREPTCSHYNDGAGKWSSDNCKKVSSSGGRTKCDCSQLGHFGLLFDLHPDELLSPLALAVISYIGAGFSILCLSLFLLTFLSSKTLRRKEHGRILINISVSLLCLYVVFVVAGLVTSVEPLCGLVAALFHYIMLVFFGWTAAEAVFLYHKLAVVLGKPIQHYVWKAGLTVWLVPLLITVISVGPGYKYYVNPYYCRATEWPFWLGHILPFSIINIFNWIVFAVIMTQLIRRRTAVKVNVDQSKKENLRQNFFIAVGLSLVLGLGWGFGLTATSSDLKELTFALQVVFSLFVGSQGVLIFVFHGLRSRQFRLVWTSAFSLKGKLGAKAYFAKKRSISGIEFNLIPTGTMLSSEASKSASLNHYSQVLSQTDTELGGSSFEPVLVGDSATPETVKDSEKCHPYRKCGEVCPPQERCGEECPPLEKCGEKCPPQERCRGECPPQERCVQEQPPTLQ